MTIPPFAELVRHHFNPNEIPINSTPGQRFWDMDGDPSLKTIGIANFTKPQVNLKDGEVAKNGK